VNTRKSDFKRDQLIETLAGQIVALERPHPTRVGIDGVDGAGKTTLADELVEPIRRRGRSVIRASVDCFHQPSAVRYARGRDSPEGYFHDSFDYERVGAYLLDPLGPGGSLHYRIAAFDYRTDSAVESPLELAEPNAILLFDGIFLHRPELVAAWDLSVFLATTFPVSIARAARRDGTAPDVDHPANRRYVEGQRLYLRECDPQARATIVIDNNQASDPL
jgi:uridine kinase